MGDTIRNTVLTPNKTSLKHDALMVQPSLQQLIQQVIAELSAASGAIYQPVDQHTMQLRTTAGIEVQYPQTIVVGPSIANALNVILSALSQPFVDGAVFSAQVDHVQLSNLLLEAVQSANDHAAEIESSAGRAATSAMTQAIHLDLEQFDATNNGVPLVPVALPLMLLDQIYGVLVIWVEQQSHCTLEQLRRIERCCTEAALLIQNEHVRNSVAVDISHERSQRAKDLYDAVSQTIFGISLGAQTALSVSSACPAELQQPLSFILTFAETAVTEIRALLFELTPQALIEQGLSNAIDIQSSAIAAHHQVKRILNLGPEPNISDHKKQSLYQIFLEAMQNCVKHSQAKRIWINLYEENGKLCLSVVDDGIGFTVTPAVLASKGLDHMVQLGSQMGAVTEITAELGIGTCVQVCLPLH